MTDLSRVAIALVNFYLDFARIDDPAQAEAAFRRSIADLNSAGAVDVGRDEGGALVLDLTPLLIASGTTYQWLFSRLAAATGQPHDELAAEFFLFLDEAFV